MDFTLPAESVPATRVARAVNWDIYSMLMPSPRRVRFPADRSMGALYAVRGNVTWHRERCGQELGEAQGEIIVPAGKKLQLCVNQEACRDLSPLAALPPSTLQMLCFDAPQHVADKQLAHISGLWNLEYLNLSGTVVSDEGLQHLSEMTELKALLLSKTNISDAGLLSVGGLTKLKYLELKTTLVRDPSLKAIQSLTGLEVIFLPCGLLDFADPKTLQAALPNRSAWILYEECSHFHPCVPLPGYSW